MALSTQIQRGIGVSVIFLVLYLTIVVVTTPNLKPFDAISASVLLNWWLIGGISLGAGVHVFILEYAKARACTVKHSRAALGSSGLISSISSFVSFLSLVPLGCCGTWIYVLSFLPGLIGAGASGFLIGNGFSLEVAGLILMTLSVAYTYLSVRRRLTQTRPAPYVSREQQRNTSARATLSPQFLVWFAVAAIGLMLLLSAREADLPAGLFGGAYATYSGTTLIPGFSQFNTTRTYRVLGFNATSVKVLITTDLDGTRLQSISWQPFSAHRRLHLRTELFVKEYPARMIVGNAYRSLTAEEYSQGNLTTTYYYVSDAAAFPVEIVTTGHLAIELTLVNTNVPGST